MDIQSAVFGTNLNYIPPNNSVENPASVLANTPTVLPVNSDSIDIAPQTTAFTDALLSVKKEIDTANNQGYPVPPPCITNKKQIDIIKKMIIGKLSSPVDDSTVSKAAETLWKDAGYRIDITPAPKDTNGSGNGYNFLTKEDRQEMDKVYDEAEANGLDATRITNDSAAEISKKRMKEVDIANGGVYGDESDITPLSPDDLAKIADDEKQKRMQSQENASSELLKSISTTKKALSLNGMLLNFLQKHKR